MHFPAKASVCFFSAALTALAADNELGSPQRTFTISQHYDRKAEDGGWVTEVRFARNAHPAITLADSYAWPALFYVSPDDQWILRVQKSGSGDNISFLYRLDPS